MTAGSSDSVVGSPYPRNMPGAPACPHRADRRARARSNERDKGVVFAARPDEHSRLSKFALELEKFDREQTSAYHYETVRIS